MVNVGINIRGKRNEFEIFLLPSLFTLSLFSQPVEPARKMADKINVVHVSFNWVHPVRLGVTAGMGGRRR